MQIDPNEAILYFNWAVALIDLASFKDDVEDVEKLYIKSFEKFRRAAALDPADYACYYFWGNGLYELALKKEGEQANQYFNEALKKYQEALSINPDYTLAQNTVQLVLKSLL